MANEQLTIQPNDARMTVIGKSWPDASTDSGGGEWDDTYNGTYFGPIPRTDLPTKIAVTTPPTKQTYTETDRIEFDGMVVTAYKEDGSVWTSADYPDGTIPLNEIISTRQIISNNSSEKNNDIRIGSIVSGGREHSFLLCTHFHIEDYYYYGNQYSSIDVVADDGFSIMVFLGNPYTHPSGLPAQNYFFIMLSDRVNSINDVPPKGFLCGRATFLHGITTNYTYSTKSDIYSDLGYYIPSGKTPTYCSRYATHSYSNYSIGSGICRPGTIQSNLPLSYIQGGLDGLSTDYAQITIQYCKADAFKNVSDVTLYWQRPGDGLYLSCTLPIFIKSDDSD